MGGWITLGLMLWTAMQAPQPAGLPGQALFEKRCSMCHVEASAPGLRAPLVSDLRALKPDQIRDALTIGEMVDNAIGLDDQDIADIALYLTGKRPTAD
jgi:mono/diheme cytochrome c family protein